MPSSLTIADFFAGTSTGAGTATESWGAAVSCAGSAPDHTAMTKATRFARSVQSAGRGISRGWL